MAFHEGLNGSYHQRFSWLVLFEGSIGFLGVATKSGLASES